MDDEGARTDYRSARLKETKTQKINIKKKKGFFFSFCVSVCFVSELFGVIQQPAVIETIVRGMFKFMGAAATCVGSTCP